MKQHDMINSRIFCPPPAYFLSAALRSCSLRTTADGRKMCWPAESHDSRHYLGVRAQGNHHHGSALQACHVRPLTTHTSIQEWKELVRVSTLSMLFLIYKIGPINVMAIHSKINSSVVFHLSKSEERKLFMSLSLRAFMHLMGNLLGI